MLRHVAIIVYFALCTFGFGMMAYDIWTGAELTMWDRGLIAYTLGAAALVSALVAIHELWNGQDKDS